MRCLSAWFLLLMLAPACAHGSQQLAPAGGFRGSLGRTHPLNGKIWSARSARFLTTQELEAELRAASFVLVGESHDNLDHHLLEAELVQRFLRDRAGAAVGFEMLDVELAPALRERPPKSAAELRRLSRWDESGWPNFALYAPVFEAVIGGGGRLVAAHPNRTDVRASMQGVPPEQATLLALSEPLAEDARRALEEEIRVGHCGHAPAPMVQAMVRAQSFKDAVMARELAQAGAPALLIAGRGHVRTDRGVPLFLARRGAHAVLSIALLEVDDARGAASAYDAAAYDLLIFTPRVSDEDACARFREQLQQLHRPPASPQSSAASSSSEAMR